MKRYVVKLLSLLCTMALIAAAVPVCYAETTVSKTLLYEGFEGSTFPSGWSTYDADGDGYCWTLNTNKWNSYLQTGNSVYSASQLPNVGAMTPDDWMMLPAVTLDHEGQVDFELSYQIMTSYMPGYPDYLQVYASLTPITDPTTLTPEQCISDAVNYSGSTYEKYTIDLNAFRGQTVYLAFRHYKATGLWQMYVDEITVSVIEPKTYPVTFSTQEDVYTVIPESGSTAAAAGFDYRFSVKVADAYASANGLLTVTANGKVLTPSAGVYTIPNVDEKQSVDITYSYKIGDMNNDGIVNMVDAMLLYSMTSGMTPMNSVQQLTGRISIDEVTNMQDAMCLYSFAAGKRAYLDTNRDLSLIWNSAYVDSANGFTSKNSVSDSAYYYNGRAIKDYSVKASSGDAKHIFYANNKARVANVADGYALTLPFDDFLVDYSLSGYRSHYETDTSVLNISKENKNPYGNREAGWNIYLTEWLNRFVANDSFLATNQITRTRVTTASTTKLSGYTVLNYDLFIQNDGEVEKPYYNIAVIRKNNEYVNFYLLVMKSTTDQAVAMDAIVKSFKEFTAQGKAANVAVTYECDAPSYWNEETTAYYDQLCAQNATDWGFFAASMVHKGSSDYNTQYNRIQTDYNRLSTAFDYEYEIMPTYTHIGWGTSRNAFPLDMANTFAGGNGFNGKPVLQLTYQFTTSNNTNLEGYTPTFDILRGEYDDLFRQIARDIKTYGKPVLFRLNNEMNTDWTSYSGIVNLLDPDIFVMTWERMYEIFLEENVDNCIWIFNPMADTTPYCNWGEDLCFLPDMEYVQAIGLTSYEMGNGDTLRSFEDRYRDLYEKNTPHFAKYPWIISEFGAGAGGEKQYSYDTNAWQDTVLGRNALEQATWVNDMFTCFAHRTEPGYEFCDRIKGAVWFSCNDYASIDGKNYVTNYFELSNDLPLTLQAFKNGLATE